MGWQRPESSIMASLSQGLLSTFELGERWEPSRLENMGKWVIVESRACRWDMY